LDLLSQCPKVDNVKLHNVAGFVNGGKQPNAPDNLLQIEKPGRIAGVIQANPKRANVGRVGRLCPVGQFNVDI